MLPKSIISILALIFYCAPYYANTTISKDKIEVEVNTNGDIIHIHTIQKHQTLYSLARFFKISPNKLMLKNDLDQSDVISLHSKIRIPIEKSEIITASEKKSHTYIPIYYRVKKKETLYTIAKKYFGQSVDGLIARNKLSSFVINENQALIVGWWESEKVITPSKEVATFTKPLESTQQLQAELNQAVNTERKTIPLKVGPVVIEKKAYKEVRFTSNLRPLATATFLAIKINRDRLNIETPIKPIPITELKSNKIEIEYRKLNTQKRALGFWDKKGDEEGEFWAFHKTAPINSKIFLKNPLTNKQATVTVVGNIDRTLYPDDIDIIITKSVAKHLQAHDTRFSLEINYYE